MPKIINETIEQVPLSLLKPHPRNVNEADFGAIQESIEANGFYGTIVASRRTGHILAGNHRYHVAKQAGMDTLPVAWVDVDEEEELRILLADNRTTRLGTDNEARLAELLTELAQTERGLVGVGFDGDDLDLMIARLAGETIDPNAEWQGMPEFDQPDTMPHRTINVHFLDDDAVADFARLVGQSLTEKTKYIWHPEQKPKQRIDTQYVTDES